MIDGTHLRVFLHPLPGGLAQQFSDLWGSLPGDVSFSIVHLSAFIAAGRHSPIRSNLAASTETCEIGNLHRVGGRCKPSNAGFLIQGVDDSLTMRFPAQLVDRFIQLLDLLFQMTDLPQQTSQRCSHADPQLGVAAELFEPLLMRFGPWLSHPRWLFDSMPLQQAPQLNLHGAQFVAQILSGSDGLAVVTRLEIGHTEGSSSPASLCARKRFNMRSASRSSFLFRFCFTEDSIFVGAST